MHSADKTTRPDSFIAQNGHGYISFHPVAFHRPGVVRESVHPAFVRTLLNSIEASGQASSS